MIKASLKVEFVKKKKKSYGENSLPEWIRILWIKVEYAKNECGLNYNMWYYNY